ncbi:cupin domain-containing protein [Pseudomonas sp. LB3P14]
MLEPIIRRVVTGQNQVGRSVIVSDGPAMALPWDGWPGQGVTYIWGNTETPADNTDMRPPEERGEIAILPPGSGAAFIIMHIPPISELEAMTPEQRERVTIPVARTFPNAMELDTSKGYGMHGTDTQDWLILLSGELTLMVDEGEVTLKPFDTVIQGGTNHGWVNRGKVPAVLLSAVIGAEALSRHAYATTRRDLA